MIITHTFVRGKIIVTINSIGTTTETEMIGAVIEAAAIGVVIGVATIGETDPGTEMTTTTEMTIGATGNYVFFLEWLKAILFLS